MKIANSKKELMDYNQLKKLELEEFKLKSFERKQEIMAKNQKVLWDYKFQHQNEQFDMNMKKLYLSWKIKSNNATEEDFEKLNAMFKKDD